MSDLPDEAVTAANNAADIWAQHTLMSPQEVGYRHAMVNAALAAAAPALRDQAAADERGRIIAIIAAEGKRLTDAAILRMAGDSLDDDDMVTQVLRGSTIGNLARRLPDLIRARSEP